MLYGHVENDEDRVDHMLRLRDAQDETGGFQTFIPLAFHPDNTALAHIPKTTGMMDLKQIAIGRLLLDNFAHIKSYWQMVSPEMAQISLRFGADDIDGHGDRGEDLSRCRGDDSAGDAAGRSGAADY